MSAFVFPMIEPVPMPDLPEVHEVLNTETQTVWWVENTRSDWTVIEDCWFSSMVSEEDWMPMEMMLRQEWLHFHPQSQLVGMDLDWRSNGFCLRVQGLPEAVSTVMVEWWDWLNEWHPTRYPVQKSEHSLSDLHRRHFEPNQRTRRRLFRGGAKVEWRIFKGSAFHKQVQFGPEILTLDPVWDAHSQLIQHPPVPNVVADDQCTIHNTTVYPEMAISIDYVPHEILDPTSMRFLSMTMGRGVRSRLSQELRETQGLLYTIGAVYQGDVIRVEFSASEIVLSDVLHHVNAVMNDLSTQPLTMDEWTTARAQYANDIYRTLENPALLTRTLGYYQQPSGWAHGVQVRLSQSYLKDVDWTLDPVHWYVTGDITWLEGTTLESVCLQP